MRRPIVAYYRVSTQRQEASGLGLEAQRKAVRDMFGDADIVEEFTETESGRNNRRPKLAQAIDTAKTFGAVLVIAKLDRLARNVHFISGLMESGVEFKACDMPEANRFTLHIMASVAEHEAHMISERTKAALAAAKARGARLGGFRSRRHRQAAIDGQTAKRDQFREQLLPIIRKIRDRGAKTFQAVAEELNDRGIRTIRGAEWTPVQVRRLELEL